MSFNDQITDGFRDLQGESAYRSDPRRAYDGQSHTTNGLRGKTEVKGLTFRDVRDCYVRAVLICSGHKTEEQIQDFQYIADDVYKCDWNNLDPIAVAQVMGCEIEKIMDIYPNVS